MNREIKSVLRHLLVALSGIAVWPAMGSSQLLYDGGGHYEENYARYGYYPYAVDPWSERRAPVFDDLGNYVMRGTTIWSSEETRPSVLLSDGSAIDKSNRGFGRRGVASGQSLQIYRDWVNNLVVAHDSHKNRASRLIVGDRIRTKFTALTLDLAGLNGVRWDLDTRKTRVSLVSSRADFPIFVSRLNAGSAVPGDNEFHGRREEPVYLMGGHVERQIGALNVGLNYANINRTDSFIDWGDHSLKGVLPSTGTVPPMMIAVKVSDGSQNDGKGARVLDLHIDGPMNDLVDVSVTRHDSRNRDQTNPNRDASFPRDRSIPPYIQFAMNEFPLEEVSAERSLEANGSEFLIYWFQIPEDMRNQVEAIRFRALVANDYAISIAEVRPFLGGAGGFGQQASYFYDVVAQEGNVQDGTNQRWIEFEYGRQSGRTVASVRVELESVGFSVRSEWARSFDFRQYPTELGRQRWQKRTGDAFFINASRQFKRFAIVGELFRMDPLYGTSLDVQSPVFKTYSDVLGSPFRGEVQPNWLDRYNDTMEFETVDDNDDKDLRADFHFLPESFGDTDGVFPGLDQDQDGRVDTNENGNRIPDYLEPFFLYNVDPPEYVPGDDLNNNGIIDHREDDRDPDYPYDADTKGHHLYVEFDAITDLKLALGRYRVEEVWGGGRNHVDYARLKYDHPFFPYARVNLTNTLRRVRDDIVDDTPQFAYFEQHGIPTDPIPDSDDFFSAEVRDELLMRNSVVNTAYIETTFLRVPNLNVNSRFKHTVNLQRASNLQAASTTHELAWVLRADYAWKMRALTLTPKVKYMTYWKKDDEGRVNEVSERQLYPILLADYALTPRTSLRAGAQGLPFLKSRHRFPLNRDVEYSSEDYIAMVSNTSIYQGHVMTLNMGYHLRQLKFEDRSRRAQDIDRALFFLRLVMGVEPFQG